jgi:hypothetical protein
VNTDPIRASIMSVVTSGLSALVLMSAVNLTAEQVAGLTLFVNNTTILFFFMFKKGEVSGT